uniref:Protein BANP n=1 Tax=Homalodisca liturata TaxID=320908 RepID=A0A1B6I9S1_9HEMI
MATNAQTKKSEWSVEEQIYNNIVQQLIVIHNSFNEKVKQLEAKIDNFVSNIKDILSENSINEKRSHCCEEVLQKLSGIENIIQNVSKKRDRSEDRNAEGGVPVVVVPNYKPQPPVLADNEGTIQVIALNSEADYPNGSWLGNEKNPEARVRVPITPSQLLHINSLCTTPEKMAIVLLDYLFSQETQAKSNLSGKGKHFKKQLDPLKIYGIKTHLIHKFNISERDWYRIKQNIDSKCRTAWRKKSMGIPLSKSKAKPTTNSEEEPIEKIIRSNSIVLAGPFISEENSQELSSMIIEDTDCFTLTGCCEQTLTIITDSGEVNVPILSTEDSLSDDHTTTDEMLGLSS